MRKRKIQYKVESTVAGKSLEKTLNKYAKKEFLARKIWYIGQDNYRIVFCKIERV